MNKSNPSRKDDDHHHNDGVDDITIFPASVLQLILSKVGTEELVRKSMLSKQWRSFCVSLPFIDIDCSRVKMKDFNKKKFKEFVYWVFVTKSQDLDSCRLSCSDYYNKSTIERWIHAAVKRNVKRLYLSYFPKKEEYDDIRLPYCLVECESLQLLKLCLSFSAIRLPGAPKDPDCEDSDCEDRDDRKNPSDRENSVDRIVFPALKMLELNRVMFVAPELVKYFFKKCRLLEELVLVDCLLYKIEYLSISCKNLKILRIDNRKLVEYEYPEGEDSDDYAYGSAFKKQYRLFYKRYYHHGLCKMLIVHCPYLKHFEFGGEVAIQFCFRLESLKKAVIYPGDMLLGQLQSSSLCELFAAVSHVESLSINYYFIQCVNDRGAYPESLLNLKTLELRTKLNAVTMNVLIQILKRSPILESLHLIIEQDIFCDEFEASAKDLDVVKTRRIVTRHLKGVEFLDFTGEHETLAIAQSLLKHGNALEKMVFSWSYKDKDSYQEKSTAALNAVSKFKRASSIVKVITRLNT